LGIKKEDVWAATVWIAHGVAAVVVAVFHALKKIRTGGDSSEE